MIHQLALIECHQHSRMPRPFFERFGYLGLCILPAEVLDDAPLSDPETGAVLPSLRQIATADGLCFAHVSHSCASGLYWAEVSSTPSLVDQESVILTEEQLAYALAWDIRLQGKCPTQIRHILFACVQESLQTTIPTKHALYEALTPAPIVPLEATEPIEVSTDDLQKALTSSLHISSRNQTASRGHKRISDFAMQQGLLRAMLAVFKQMLNQAQEQAELTYLQAYCVLLTQMQHWQRQTHQRVVHLDRGWSRKQRSVIWHLTLGVPESILAANSFKSNIQACSRCAA